MREELSGRKQICMAIIMTATATHALQSFRSIACINATHLGFAFGTTDPSLCLMVWRMLVQLTDAWCW